MSSYHRLWADVANTRADVADGQCDATFLPDQPLALPDALKQKPVMHWRDVKAAIRHSAGFFMQRRLQAGLGLDWQDSETEEPFVLAGLEAYLLKEQQLQRLLDAHSGSDSDALAALFDQFVRQHQALGDLPVNALGQVQAQRLNESILPLLEALQPFAEREQAALQLDLTLASVHPELEQLLLEGELNGLVDGLLLNHRVGGLRGRHILDVWLDLVFGVAATAQTQVQPQAQSQPRSDTSLRPDTAWLFGISKTGALESLLIRAPEPALASELARKAVVFTLQSWCQPQPVLPDLLFSLASSEADQHGKLIERALALEYGELTDEALLRCLPTLRDDLLDDAYSARWQADYQWLFEPLLAHLGEPEDDTTCTGKKS